MRKEEIIILTSEDIINTYKDLNFNDITSQNFKLDLFNDVSIIMYIDDEGYTKVIVNRYGKVHIQNEYKRYVLTDFNTEAVPT